jgi:hypothetical protein
MITIPGKVEELVNQSPFLREAMTDKLINLSALARQLQPQIEKELIKDVSESAVFIALQRYAASMKPFYHENPADYLANLGIKSDLFELTVENSPELLGKLSRLAKSIEDRHAALFVFTQGQHETTIITSKALELEIRAALKGMNITGTIPELTGITLQRTHDQIKTTGLLQFPLRILAWEGISVVEIITTLHEMMIIIQTFDVDRAFTSIRQGFEAAKTQGHGQPSPSQA